MAGYKETPRQKMISMMYLVLTALLALNVSKEILDAFLVVNESIEVTNENFSHKIDKVYADFQGQYSLNKEKVQDEWDAALKAQKYSRRLEKYVDSIKFEMIAKTEGVPFDTAKIIELVNIKKKDNYDIPTNFLVGSDTKRGVAKDMVDSINVYREKMLKLVDEDVRDNFDKRIGLKTDGTYKNATGQTQDWVTHNFYHTILAADITILNKIKAEIYNAESDIVSYLYSSITKEDFKFSDVQAKVIQNSNYIFQGDDYTAEIIVAAIDETQNPVIHYLENADTMLQSQLDNPNVVTIEGEGGSVNLTLPANSEGMKKYAGLIEMKDPMGIKSYYPFKREYIVAKPSATISPTKMNVFYRGVDNPVSISASGLADSQIHPTITDGSITRTDTGWVVNKISTNAFETTISVRSKDGKIMGSQYFRVKPLPNPLAKIYGSKEGKISKKKMLTNPFLLCRLPEYVDFKYDFKVLSFTMIVPSGGGGQFVSTEKAESNMFTDKMKNLIESLKKDDIVIFQDIKVQGPERTRKIESINVTIQ
jgi:gliding motility-associated protein GldM